MIEALYTQFHTYLLARCTALCRDSAEAEDLVQETFLRALTHIGNIQDLSREQCRAWLYKTAQRLYIDGTLKDTTPQSWGRSSPYLRPLSAPGWPPPDAGWLGGWRRRAADDPPRHEKQ